MKANTLRDQALVKRFLVYGLLLLAVALAWVQSRRQPMVNVAAVQAPQAAVDEALLVLSRPLLLPADGNPFPVQGASRPTAEPVPVTEPLPAPPPPPEAPDLAVEIVGRMTTVDGKEEVYALHQGQPLKLVTGQILPNGYVVKRMAPDAIEFEYPSMNAMRRVELPPTPKFEVR